MPQIENIEIGAVLRRSTHAHTNRLRVYRSDQYTIQLMPSR